MLLGLECIIAGGGGGLSDELEVAWLAECSSKTLDEQASSDLALSMGRCPHGYSARWKRLDTALASAILETLGEGRMYMERERVRAPEKLTRHTIGSVLGRKTAGAVGVGSP